MNLREFRLFFRKIASRLVRDSTPVMWVGKHDKQRGRHQFGRDLGQCLLLRHKVLIRFIREIRNFKFNLIWVLNFTQIIK